MLELCHSTLVYNTNNLIWQLTTTRQIFLLPCLSSRPGLYAPASSPALIVVLIRLPGGMSWWSKLTEKYSFFCLTSRLPPRLVQWRPGSGREEERKMQGPAHGQQRTLGSLLCTHTFLWSKIAVHCWLAGSSFTLFTICTVEVWFF